MVLKRRGEGRSQKGRNVKNKETKNRISTYTTWLDSTGYISVLWDISIITKTNLGLPQRRYSDKWLRISIPAAFTKFILEFFLGQFRQIAGWCSMISKPAISASNPHVENWYHSQVHEDRSETESWGIRSSSKKWIHHLAWRLRWMKEGSSYKMLWDSGGGAA